MNKILISACLMGQKVRYDGDAKTCISETLTHWQDEGRLVSFCPEVAGGMSTPRAPAEILGGVGGDAVLRGDARIMDRLGEDVTQGFTTGAQAALKTARDAGCAHAILTESSPSCGSGFIYSGDFSGQRVAGMGVTAALLQQHGISVWSEAQIGALASIINA